LIKFSYYKTIEQRLETQKNLKYQSRRNLSVNMN